MTVLAQSKRLHTCFVVPRSRSCSAAWARTSPLTALPQSGSLEEIISEIQRLCGKQINVNSPKQVSTAIFGCVQSTSREALEQAIRNQNLNERQRQLAVLVQKYRDLSREVTQVKKNGNTLESRRFLSSSVVGAPIVNDEHSSHLNDESPWNNSTDTAQVNHQQKLYQQEELTPFQRKVETLFIRNSKIDHCWKEPLLQISKATAQNLIDQLDPLVCPMGFDPLAAPHDPLRAMDTSPTTTTTTITAGKKGSFLAFCREQKEKYPDAIILTRCGDFYETFGIDAVLLVEHCGLNAMAGKPKAGCPVRNVQATLDCLTAQGFRVAVYEEAADTDSSSGAPASGGAKSRIKNRFLAQIVSPASPTYLYDLVLLNGADALATVAPSRPYVGVLSLAAGYTLVEISTEERSVRVAERLTAEAIACRLAAYPPADPIIYVPSMGEYESLDGSFSLPFLPSRLESSRNGPGSRLRMRIVSPSLVEEPRVGISDIERAKNVVVRTLLQMIAVHEDDTSSSRARASVDDFVLVESLQGSELAQTHPLHLETATQLGLMNEKAIPSLVSYLLHDSAPAATRRFLRRFLLTPPPPKVGDAMRSLVLFLKKREYALPPLSVPPVGKVLALLRAGQASASVYGEILRSLDATVVVLDALRKEPAILDAFMILLEYESGMAADSNSLRRRCADAITAIEEVISPLHYTQRHQTMEADRINDFGNLVPAGFFERNEAPWRGRVRMEAIPAAYASVGEAAVRLAEAVVKDFWRLDLVDFKNGTVDESKSPIVQDIFNNIFALRDVPKGVDESTYLHPRDRFGKLLRNRYTTELVQESLGDYVSACDRAKQCVAGALGALSVRLHDEGHIPAVVQAAHANLILSTAFFHAAKANSLGWNIARVCEADQFDKAGHFVDLRPYWMDRGESVANTFELSGVWLLTAPNMAGKSTILRSTAAAALLSVCGLCAPLGEGSYVRRFDHLFVRGASSDVPTEQKSAFGAEMGDIAALLRCCGTRSLVFVDELGRGTSPRDGTRLAAAVLEELANQGMSGIFATHLHDILELPLKSCDRIVRKRMAIDDSAGSAREFDRFSWTYRIEDGVCTDSMALATAARFGVPCHVLQRAAAFGDYLPAVNPSVVDAMSLSFAQQGSEVPSGIAAVEPYIESITGQKVLSVPAGWNVPASLDGQSCLYVLSSGDGYYVGESDRMRMRLQQHRLKGNAWGNVEALVVPIPQGKSRARSLESVLIQKLAKAGFTLHSTSDGQSVRTNTQNC